MTRTLSETNELDVKSEAVERPKTQYWLTKDIFMAEWFYNGAWVD